jgi:hypothetical protein
MIIDLEPLTQKEVRAWKTLLKDKDGNEQQWMKASTIMRFILTIEKGVAP